MNKTPPLITGVLSLVLIVISKIVELSSGEKVKMIAWAASFFVMLTAIIIRFSIDTDRFDEQINTSSVIPDIPLDSMRFLNWMPIAMIVGMIATVVINLDGLFIPGMLVYLIMQFCLIRAFSGIFHIKPSIALSNLGNTAKISMISWTTIIVLVFLIFVNNGSESLIVVPYVVVLGIMAHYTWYGLAYDRNWKFRYIFPLASAIFVFSDALIGNNAFGINKLPENIFYLIDITYLLNVFLMTMGMMMLDEE